MAEAFVGLDLGTTSIKAVAFDSDDAVVASAERQTPTHTVPSGGEFDAEEIWETACSVLRVVTLALVDSDHVPMGIAVASMGESGVLVDAFGDPVAPVVAWFDDRTEPQADWWIDTIGVERTRQVAGLTPKAVFGAAKMLWTRDNLPDAWRKGQRWLNMADWAAFRLTGEVATDYSLASRTMLFDLERHSWSSELCEAAGIERALLAPLVQSGTRVGEVTPDAAEATGLPAGMTVGAGGQDHVCAALALGVTAPGMMLDSIGTAEAFFLVTDGFDRSGRIAGAGINQGAHVEPGQTYAMTGMLGGGRIDQRRQELGHDWEGFLATPEAHEVIDQLANDGQARSDVMLAAAETQLTQQVITGGGSQITRLIEQKRLLSPGRLITVAGQRQATALGAAKLARRACQR